MYMCAYLRGGRDEKRSGVENADFCFHSDVVRTVSVERRKHQLGLLSGDSEEIMEWTN